MAAETVPQQLEIINKLIETCRDGQAGFLEAAEFAHNAELKRFFSNQAMERARFAAELERAALRLNSPTIGISTSLVNKVHRAWIDLKHKFGAGDASVLGSVETGECNAKVNYTEALAADLPEEVRSIIERQAESVSMTYSQVCALRTMYKKAA